MQEQPPRKTGLLRLIFSLSILVVAVLFFVYRQVVFDQITVWQYPPGSESKRLVESTDMSPNGAFLFYASRPQINQSEQFNDNCSQNDEQTIVLGCYVAKRIYVFNVTDERLEGVKEVTAAHEMLHAAYDRFSDSQRKSVDALLQDQLDMVQDKKLQDLIAVYDKTEPGEKLNELHSIFGTQVADLTPELEEHYRQFFNSRRPVVSLSKQYESVFDMIRQQQETLTVELNTLAEQVSASIDGYNSDATQLSSDIGTFNSRANNGGYSSQAAFNADRQRLIDRQEGLSASRAVIAESIALYNSKREELRSLNGQAAELNKSINSNSLKPAPEL